MIMDSIKDISKDKDIIRILGRMPDSVMDKDPEEEGKDILDCFYEVPIGRQDNLMVMLQNAGYKVTSGDSYTAVIIGEKVSKEMINSLPEGCKKIDVNSLAAWLVENHVAHKKYKFKKTISAEESSEEIDSKGDHKILGAIIAGIIVIAAIVIGGPLLLLLIIFVPGAMKILVRSFIK